MTLAGVLKGAQVRGEVPREWRELRVASLAYDSRRVEKATLFFAFAGARVDGRQFAREALARGACAVVSELAPSEDMGAPASAPWIQVEHGRKALAVASRNFYERPDERVSLPASPAPTARPPRRTWLTRFCGGPRPPLP